MELSDARHPCMTVVPRGFTVRAWRSLVRAEAGPPGFRTPCVPACQRSATPPGPSPARHNEIDGNRNIRANLKHYQPDLKTIVPETRIGYGRKRSSLRDIVLCVDQSGSMATSRHMRSPTGR